MKVAGVAAGAATALAMALLPLPARAEVLYTLDTQCSLKAGAAQACTVEATEEEEATLYRHTIGDRVELIRISEDPTRMSRWDPTSRSWTSLTSAGALLSSNTVCFNGRDLCVVNPNYLNSIVEEKPEVYEGRDLVRVKFGPDGRVDLTCFDEACEEVK
jgi:hypothetical protein